MARPTSLLKRLLLGRPFRSDRLQHTLLPKRIALPVFASDALSSVAYAPDEILLTLSIAGASAFFFSPWVALAVVVVMLTVVASYRQNVHAYPSGGGDYEVATVNLGPKAGLAVASALLVDYVLTVAVSVSSGVANLGSVVPFVATHKVLIAVSAVVLLTAINLRGLRESGTAFAIPTYGFVIVIGGMLLTGLVRVFVLGDDLRAPSAGLEIQAEHSVTGFALVFLLLRTFSSGCAALTGVEAISNGVPAFKAPKSKNAATTLLLLGGIAVTMLVGIIWLSRLTGLQFVEDPRTQIVSGPVDYVQKTVTVQLGETVFGGGSVLLYVVAGMTALILFLAANTAFNGFPVLGSILAQDRYLPRQLHTRGDRLAFSNGILFLAVFAVVLIIGFQAEVTKLIQLYIVGVFVSFTLSQAGMIRHWNRHLRNERDPEARRRMLRSRAINTFGMVMTGVVLVIVLATKFLLGAWIAIVAMAVMYVVMLGIRRHYDRVAEELEPTEQRGVLPARNHAIVLVSKLHKPTLRAVAYARATRPDTLTAVTVNVDEQDTRELQADWERRELPVPLTVIDSPYREITRPILNFVASVRRESPRDVVTVFIPEYVVGRWWENLLHNQSALRLKGRLLFEPGVMVTSVPWQLASTASKNLDRLDATLSRGPARGPRVAPQSTLPPPVASTPSAPSAPSTPSAPSAEREERP
ncbi:MULTISPECIES: APC family permease [Micromonospora]|uniref:APC family permease n=1 Tax=Micromonospora TaxID=1873 RepID=UPI0005BAC108|nr:MULTISPECIES: APC family permease [unclassified Micromonospora]MBP1781665.1 amino acid transporter [Micromonospora sp. HB375]MBQ1063238.1 amino acid permease [Micromonospora sp. C41]MBQ1065472.1 amino acid permease [Micromonospora sp. D75]MCK1808929.1 amino acid permease [Micromonospora sp. R42106]MCK1831808.1 amino acid permease [Micromonospora sp. R42003]